MGKFKKHEPCPQCGSSDALARYTDQTGYCFACHTYEPNSHQKKPKTSSLKRSFQTKPKKSFTRIKGVHRSLKRRKISLRTAKFFDYQVAKRVEGRWAHVANYKNAHGLLLGQKLRFEDKSFRYHGKTPMPLFGMHLWSKGKSVVLVEGEIDALSVGEVFSCKVPVVSLPNGAASALKSLKIHLDWFEGFDSVILAFDQDEAGQKATQEIQELFPPGKVKIATLPLKDANDILLADRASDLRRALLNATPYRPDGVLEGVETWSLAATPLSRESISYPFSLLNQKTRGIRFGEIVTFCAGSGIGKSQVCREIAYHLIQKGQKVGYVALEESVRYSIRSLMSLALEKPLHLDEEDTVSEKALREVFKEIAPFVAFYDHFGSLDPKRLFNRLRYMVLGLGTKVIILDHVSIVISGLREGDERRLIDNVMTELRSLVEELGFALILVSHLKRPEGKGHEEGAKTSLAHLRGSAAIAQLSDIVVGLERNQQGLDPNLTKLRILKNRFTGETGLAGSLLYCKETGRLNSEYTSPSPL